MAQPFQFKQFSISQEHSALKLGTDAVLLGSIARFNHPKSLLDIGTGTGILALMMAQNYDCPIMAIDIDAGAIEDARLNIENSPWIGRIEAKTISVQDFVAVCSNKFDGIVCNPPFFSNSLHCDEHKKTIARHAVSLTPLDLFRSVETLLSDSGVAYVIIPSSEKMAFESAARICNLLITNEIDVYPYADSESHNRIIFSFAKSWKPLTTKSIYIRNVDRTYSCEYKDLTKDFYLHLH